MGTQCVCFCATHTRRWWRVVKMLRERQRKWVLCAHSIMSGDWDGGRAELSWWVTDDWVLKAAGALCVCVCVCAQTPNCRSCHIIVLPVLTFLLTPIFTFRGCQIKSGVMWSASLSMMYYFNTKINKFVRLLFFSFFGVLVKLTKYRE